MVLFNENKVFKIRNDNFTETPRAVGVFVRRIDGVRLHNPEYFPKSQIQLKQTSTGIEIVVPDWLFRKKILPGYQIIEN